MKIQIPLLLISCLLLTTEVQAQNSGAYYKIQQHSGIYLSVADYQQHKLTLPVNCDEERSRVRMNDFLGRSHITVIYQGKKHLFLKDTIYGLRTCEGHDFRFFNRQLFEIEELKSVVVYRRIILESSAGVKGVKPVAHYYFSTGVSSLILPLTRTALEHTFPNNEKLHELLESQFHDGRDALSTYDSFHHTFKINRILQASL